MNGWHFLKIDLDLILNDPKMIRMSGPVFKLYVNLMCLAKRTGEGIDGSLPSAEDSALILHYADAEFIALVAELIKLGMVAESNGNLSIPNFKSSQDADTSAERMRRYRDANSKKRYEASREDVTKRNAPVTTPLHGRNTESESESESESEIESESEEEGESESESGKKAAAATPPAPVFINPFYEQNKSILTEIGVANHGARQRLANLPHVTPDYLRQIIARWRKRNTEIGLLTKMIDDQDRPDAEPAPASFPDFMEK